jgi:hypothetical protein
MTCPYKDCGYFPKRKTDSQFSIIKTHKYRDHTDRGHTCPKCKRSFISEQTAKAIPYYKKEKQPNAVR